jgi:hypothetical protein
MTSMNATGFAQNLLAELGAPQTPEMVDFIVRWEAAEGGAWNNAEAFNPLNVAAFDSDPTNPQSVMANWAAGLNATVSVLQQSNFSDLLNAIMSGDANSAEQALIASPWASSHYNGGSSFPSSAGNYGSQMLDDGVSNEVFPNKNTGVDTSGNVSTDGSGVSTSNSGVAAFLPAVTPTLSMASLQSQYPMVAALVNAVPELSQIMQQAVQGQWSTDAFIAAVQNSSWWQTTSASARQAISTMNSDPATWAQTVTNLQSTLTDLAASYGANITQTQLNSIASQALMSGNDTNESYLRGQLEQYITPVSGIHYGGEAGADETQLRQAMLSAGVQLSQPTLASDLQQIVGGKMTVQDVLSALQTQSAAKYPAYATQINQGMNLSDIADPYISRAQQLLESGPGQTNVNSPIIQNALQYTLDGKPTSMPMSDFETAVRKTPQWQSTDNAQNAFMATAHQVLNNFGLTY